MDNTKPIKQREQDGFETRYVPAPAQRAPPALRPQDPRHRHPPHHHHHHPPAPPPVPAAAARGQSQRRLMLQGRRPYHRDVGPIVVWRRHRRRLLRCDVGQSGVRGWRGTRSRPRGWPGGRGGGRPVFFCCVMVVVGGGGGKMYITKHAHYPPP